MSILTGSNSVHTNPAQGCHCGGTMNRHSDGRDSQGLMKFILRCNLCGATRDDQKLKTKPYPDPGLPKHLRPKEEATTPPEALGGSETAPDTETTKDPEPVKMTGPRGNRTNPKAMKPNQSE